MQPSSLNYNHLYYFHVAASEGSLARAAERLGVTQPTVSEQIRQLERRLGVRLFERSTTGLTLTPEGRRAYEHTTPMFRAGERLVAAMADHPATPVRTLAIGATPYVARVLGRELIVPLFAVPGRAPVVRTGALAELVRALREHQIDLLLADSEPAGIAGKGLEVTEIHRIRLVAVAATATVVGDAWIDTPLIGYPPGSTHRGEVEGFLAAHDLRPPFGGETEDPHLMLDAVLGGGLIACVPQPIARAALAEHRVRALALLDPSEVAVHAISHDAELARAALEHLARDVEARDGRGGDADTTPREPSLRRPATLRPEAGNPAHDGVIIGLRERLG